MGLLTADSTSEIS